MKRFIKLLFISLILLLVTGCASNEVLVTPFTVDGYIYDDLPLIQEIINQEQARMGAAHQMAESARQLNYGEGHNIIQTAKIAYSEAEGRMNYYLEIQDKLRSKWAEKEEEYPVATYIWTYLKNQGYSNEVCAGVMGNLMQETGGGTLSLDPMAWSSSHAFFGICQWGSSYKAVWNKDLAYQCDFLMRTIRYEMDNFTTAGYDAFLKVDSARGAAELFLRGYERAGNATLKQRQQNAVVAYNYFLT